jgi:hypothetical protein
MRLRTVFFIIALVGCLVSFCLFPLQSDDLFMYLAVAKKFFETGHLPAMDPFLVKELPWHMEHQWLSYFFFYGLYQWGGYTLITVAKVLLFIGTIIIPFVVLPRTSLRWAVGGFSVLLSCLAADFRFFERSEIFTSFFLLIVFLICRQELEKPSRWKWMLPSVFALWVNLHPGFYLGWAILGAALLVSAWQKPRQQTLPFAISGILSIAACWLNPLGTAGVLYPWEFSRTYAPFLRQYYFEWYSPFHPLLRQSPHLSFLILLWLLTLTLLILRHLLWRQWQRPPWLEWLVFVLMTVVMATGIRFAPTFCFILIALNLSLVPREVQGSRFQQLLLASSLMLAAVAVKNIFWGYETISGRRQVALGVDQRVVPQEAVEWMKQHDIKGPLYNSHMFGAYLAWAWDGKCMYDGSVVDPEYFLNEYSRFARSPTDFAELVEKYHIRSFLLDRFIDARPLVEILTHDPRWKLVFINEGSLIFTRQP